MVKKEEFTFDSRDGKTKLHAVRWVPEGKVICILQIIHGMAEYIERYEPLAQFLGEKGILVTVMIIWDMGRVWNRRGLMDISVSRIRQQLWSGMCIV